MSDTPNVLAAIACAGAMFITFGAAVFCAVHESWALVAMNLVLSAMNAMWAIQHATTALEARFETKQKADQSA